MNTYPLAFTCREVVAGTNFSAAVDISGRALLEFDGEAWSVAGVDPGGFSDTGTTAKEAYENFRMTLKTILLDCLDATPDNFLLFCSAVRSFGGSKNAATEVRWESARAEIRKGAELSDPFASCLPKRTNQIYAAVEIVRLDQMTDDLREKTNVVTANENLAAAA